MFPGRGESGVGQSDCGGIRAGPWGMGWRRDALWMLGIDLTLHLALGGYLIDKVVWRFGLIPSRSDTEGDGFLAWWFLR